MYMYKYLMMCVYYLYMHVLMLKVPLYHVCVFYMCRVWSGEKWELILLLPGNDVKVHCYKETTIMTSDKVCGLINNYTLYRS